MVEKFPDDLASLHVSEHRGPDKGQEPLDREEELRIRCLCHS